eukprot:6201168-Pleurochrysis_carterae.AAC.4
MPPKPASSAAPIQSDSDDWRRAIRTRSLLHETCLPTARASRSEATHRFLAGAPLARADVRCGDESLCSRSEASPKGAFRPGSRIH